MNITLSPDGRRLLERMARRYGGNMSVAIEHALHHVSACDPTMAGETQGVPADIGTSVPPRARRG